MTHTVYEHRKKTWLKAFQHPPLMFHITQPNNLLPQLLKGYQYLYWALDNIQSSYFNTEWIVEKGILMLNKKPYLTCNLERGLSCAEISKSFTLTSRWSFFPAKWPQWTVLAWEHPTATTALYPPSQHTMLHHTRLRPLDLTVHHLYSFTSYRHDYIQYYHDSALYMITRLHTLILHAVSSTALLKQKNKEALHSVVHWFCNEVKLHWIHKTVNTMYD